LWHFSELKSIENRGQYNTLFAFLLLGIEKSNDFLRKDISIYTKADLFVQKCF